MVGRQPCGGRGGRRLPPEPPPAGRAGFAGRPAASRSSRPKVDTAGPSGKAAFPLELERPRTSTSDLVRGAAAQRGRDAVAPRTDGIADGQVDDAVDDEAVATCPAENADRHAAGRHPILDLGEPAAVDADDNA